MTVANDKLDKTLFVDIHPRVGQCRGWTCCYPREMHVGPRSGDDKCVRASQENLLFEPSVKAHTNSSGVYTRYNKKNSKTAVTA